MKNNQMPALKINKRFGRCIAGIVAFSTAYSLVLPAITIDHDTAEEDPGIVLTEEETVNAETTYTETGAEVQGEMVEEPQEEVVVEETSEPVQEEEPEQVAEEKTEETVTEEPVIEETKQEEVINTQEENNEEPIQEPKAIAGELSYEVKEDYVFNTKYDEELGLTENTQLEIQEIYKEEEYTQYLEAFQYQYEENLKKENKDTKYEIAYVRFYNVYFLNNNAYKEIKGKTINTYTFHEPYELKDNEELKVFYINKDGNFKEYNKDENNLSFKYEEKENNKIEEIFFEDKEGLNNFTIVAIRAIEEKQEIEKQQETNEQVTEEQKEVTAEEIKEETVEEVTEETENSEEIQEEDIYTSGIFTEEGKGYKVTLSYNKDAKIPEGSRLFVREIIEDSKTHNEYLTEAEGKVENISYARFFDISIIDKDGNEIEPSAAVDVRIIIDNAPEADDIKAVHFTEEETQVIDTEKNEEEVSFTTESFSVYGVVYTVDFHYESDGQKYSYSITGGGYISLKELVSITGIATDDPETEKDETQAFVNNVADVVFSDSELVSIYKAEEEITVREIKDKLGLECEYSAELTEEEINNINNAKIDSADWVLISVKPFNTYETLTITLKNGETIEIQVTDAQISTHVMTAKGEHFRITVTYEADANIPNGAVLVAEEIPEGTDKYEEYLEETAKMWEEDERKEYISFARFFDIEIQKDGTKIEPAAPVEVEIVHEDGLAFSENENLSVIHFAENGTEIIDEIHRNEDSTQVVYEQGSFSVIGTVSTIKENGWPTSNGQFVLVLQDGDDYYAMKQDGTLTKIRYFNNTVSFIGEGTTTTDYINDYLWYVVSSGNRGKISDEYTEYNATPDGQTFIDPNNADILSSTSRQLQIRDGKIYCNGQLPGSSGYTQVTLSASNGQLSRVALTSNNASPVFFANVSSFTANENETDLFTQVEVESIIEKWKEQKTQNASYDKTAEVYDYENRVYQIDITASSSDYEVSPSIALEFVVDASRSMFFPTSVTEVGTFNGTNASNVRDWINAHGDTNQVYFVIQNKNGAATQYAIFYDPNSEYTVTEQYWNGRRWVTSSVTHKGQWLWVDASNYNPPDDVANGGTKNARTQGNPLSSWNQGNMDDGKIYTTGITGTSNGTYGERKTWISRIEYLKQCVRVASQVIYAVDENAQIGLIGFNANTTDYGTFGKDEQDTLLSKLDNISLAGGTDHQGGLQEAINKYKNARFYAEHYAGRKHVVVLVTDGAPNKSGVTWTTIGNTATTLKNLKDDFGNKTELYTMGLSLTNVGTNQTNLFGISSGAGYTYAGEDAAQIINAVTKMVDGIFVQANLVADVTDVIDPVFYPVNKADGMPLAENEWINLEGRKVNTGANDAAGQIKKDPSTGNWYAEWKNQSIDWPTTDSNGAIAEPGWHGTVFVKAKEDFLGGNGISTNAQGSKIEASKYIVSGESTMHDLPAGDHTTTFETPYVNVDELDITKNDSEWTVYLGTNVDPLKELKALWEEIKVKEVVTKTDADHRISSDGQFTYQYASNTNDNRAEVNEREEITLADLGITLTDDDWNELISEQSKRFTYSAYNHEGVGTIMISLTQEVTEGEKDLTESPHATTVAKDEAEKYTLTIRYIPAGANISNWHTGSYSSGMSGNRAGNIIRDNTHIINVYAKGLQITKVDLNDRVLTGAKFALYRTARDGETELSEINGEQYFKVAELDTSATGVALIEQIERLEEGEQYYLAETQVPAGYTGISPIPVNLIMTDVFTPKPGTTTQTTMPESGIYDWTQNTTLILNAESGVKQTDADNTVDLTHSGTKNANHETIYYRIINNPGVALPNTGGCGTQIFTIIGSIMILAAAAILWTRRRLA